MTQRELWERYKKYLCVNEGLGLSLDISRMQFPDGFFERMAGPMRAAFDAMEALEKGAIANPDEQRMVGHYWLRAPELAPSTELRKAIQDTVADIHRFSAELHASNRFQNVLVIGIG